MQSMSVSRWLTMASMAMAVLPVLRSPMMSSRWPRPMGTIASMARRPVWTGSHTGWRSMMPGALNSMGATVRGRDGTKAVDGLAKGVHDAAKHCVAGRDVHDAAGGTALVTPP